MNHRELRVYCVPRAERSQVGHIQREGDEGFPV